MTTANTSSTTRIAGVPAGRSGRAARGGTVFSAAAAAVAGWAVLVPVADVDLATRTGPDGAALPVGPGAVLVSALLCGLAGWGLLAVLERFSSNARRIWTVTASVVLVLSMTGPFQATSTGATAALVSLHLLVGGILIAGLRHRPLGRVDAPE